MEEPEFAIGELVAAQVGLEGWSGSGQEEKMQARG
jgi:hypothetical protein